MAFGLDDDWIAGETFRATAEAWSAARMACDVPSAASRAEAARAAASATRAFDVEWANDAARDAREAADAAEREAAGG
jgi:hypothetical protein